MAASPVAPQRRDWAVTQVTPPRPSVAPAPVPRPGRHSHQVALRPGHCHHDARLPVPRRRCVLTRHRAPFLVHQQSVTGRRLPCHYLADSRASDVPWRTGGPVSMSAASRCPLPPTRQLARAQSEAWHGGANGRAVRPARKERCGFTMNAVHCLAGGQRSLALLKIGLAHQAGRAGWVAWQRSH